MYVHSYIHTYIRIILQEFHKILLFEQSWNVSKRENVCLRSYIDVQERESSVSTYAIVELMWREKEGVTYVSI